MATFGNTGVESSSFPMTDDRVYTTRFTLSEAGTVTKLTARVTSDGGGGTGGNWKGVIYSSTSNSPDALLGVTAAVSISATDVWVDLTFSSSVELAAGDYFLGVVGGNSSFNTRLSTGGSGHDSEAQVSGFSYASPPDPWGTTSNTYDARASIYATYTAGIDPLKFFQSDGFQIGGYIPGASSGVSGTLDVSIGTITVSATGDVEIEGTHSSTVAAITVSASGDVEIEGTSSVTVGDITVSSSGDVEIEGTLSVTVGDVTVAGTGTVGFPPIEGTLSVTVGDVTVSSTGDVEVEGTLGVTVSNITVAGTGKVEIEGTSAVSIADVTVSGSGDVEVEGTLSSTVGDVTLSSTVDVEIEGTLSSTIAAVTVAGTGTVYTPGADDAHVLQIKGTAPGSPSSTLVVSFDSLPAVGSLVVVQAVATGTSHDTLSISDNQGNTYTATEATLSGDTRAIRQWTAPVGTSSGTFTITITPSGGSTDPYWEVIIAEVENADNTSPVVDSALVSVFETTPVVIDLDNTPVDGCVIIGLATYGESETITAGSGFSVVTGVSADRGIYKEAGTAGSHDPTWSITGSGMTIYGAGIIIRRKPLEGTLNVTVGAVTVAGTGTVLVEGTLSSSLDNITVSASGDTEIEGTLSSTIAAITVSSSGDVEVRGTLGVSIGDVTLSGTGSVGTIISGTLNVTIENVTSSGTGKVEVEGTLTSTVEAVTLSATGSTADAITGTLSVTIGAITVVANADTLQRITGIGATLKAGSSGGGLIKKAYSKLRFRQENMKWPTKGR